MIQWFTCPLKPLYYNHIKKDLKFNLGTSWWNEWVAWINEVTRRILMENYDLDPNLTWPHFFQTWSGWPIRTPPTISWWPFTPHTPWFCGMRTPGPNCGRNRTPSLWWPSPSTPSTLKTWHVSVYCDLFKEMLMCSCGLSVIHCMRLVFIQWCHV